MSAFKEEYKKQYNKLYGAMMAKPYTGDLSVLDRFLQEIEVLPEYVGHVLLNKK